jgi:hypothetical protein
MPHFELLVPAVNTGILLSSSLTLHFGHEALMRGRRDGLIAGMLMTIFLGAIFLCGQAYEYGFLNGGAFNIRSGIFGTTFFMLTGFHGLHVLIGIIFLNVVCGAWSVGGSRPSNTRLRAASWYWHFVDAVWILCSRSCTSSERGSPHDAASRGSDPEHVRDRARARGAPSTCWILRQQAGGSASGPSFTELKQRLDEAQSGLTSAVAEGSTERVAQLDRSVSTTLDAIESRSSSLDLLSREGLNIQVASARQCLVALDRYASSGDVDLVTAQLKQLGPIVTEIDTILERGIRIETEK